MQSWLLLAALQAAPIASPGVDLRGLAPAEIGHLAKTRALDMHIQEGRPVGTPIPLIRGMIVRHQFGPNAAVGVGLANLYDRRKSGLNAGSGPEPKHSKKPAVTFVLKF